jgi:hypothetical protein
MKLALSGKMAHNGGSLVLAGNYYSVCPELPLMNDL